MGNLFSRSLFVTLFVLAVLFRADSGSAALDNTLSLGRARQLAGQDVEIAVSGPGLDTASSAGGSVLYLPLILRHWPPIPDAPHLSPIVNPNHDSSYLVLWSASWFATYYVLEEATNSSFSDAQEVFVGMGLLYSAVNKSPGTYYYRVKAVYQVQQAYSSPWSNVVSTRVGVIYTYYDDFSNPNSGWPHRTFVSDQGYQILSTFYLDNGYYMRILFNDGFSYDRMGVIPAPYRHYDDSYDVEVDQIFVQASSEPPDWAKAGLVFRGDLGDQGYFTSIYVIEWNYEGNCAASHYGGSAMDSYAPAVGVPDPIFQGWVHCPSTAGGYGHNVHALAQVRGDTVTMYLNGTWIGEFTGIGGNNYMGLVTGAWQATPVESRFDNFRVTDR